MLVATDIRKMLGRVAETRGEHNPEALQEMAPQTSGSTRRTTWHCEGSTRGRLDAGDGTRRHNVGT